MGSSPIETANTPKELVMGHYDSQYEADYTEQLEESVQIQAKFDEALDEMLRKFRYNAGVECIRKLKEAKFWYGKNVT